MRGWRELQKEAVAMKISSKIHALRQNSLHCSLFLFVLFYHSVIKPLYIILNYFLNEKFISNCLSQKWLDIGEAFGFVNLAIKTKDQF